MSMITVRGWTHLQLVLGLRQLFWQLCEQLPEPGSLHTYCPSCLWGWFPVRWGATVRLRSQACLETSSDSAPDLCDSTAICLMPPPAFYGTEEQYEVPCICCCMEFPVQWGASVKLRSQPCLETSSDSAPDLHHSTALCLMSIFLPLFMKQESGTKCHALAVACSCFPVQSGATVKLRSQACLETLRFCS